MGTRSTIHFYDKNGRNLVNIYTQYDGYYQGVGKEIYEFFNNKENYGNGFSDTALLFVAQYKGNSAYDRYLTTETDEQEYNYYIYEDYDKIQDIKFGITKEIWLEDKREVAIITALRYGSIEEFKNELETEAN